MALAMALACDREAPAPPEPAQPSPQQREQNALAYGIDVDANNLLNLAYGASVISRTGESTLELSALHAIDGISTTGWSSPPEGARQTLVFALATPSRIDHLGVTSDYKSVPRQVRFEASSDGRRWREILVQKSEALNETQMVTVKPFDALYLRVETIEPRSYYSTFQSIHVLGKELEPPAPRDWSGCWTINGRPARFKQDGARVTGVIATNPPTWIDGGSDGRVARVVWLRSPNRGYATISMDPKTRHLSGLTMHDEILVQWVTEAWFGTPCETSASADLTPESPGTELGELLDRMGHWSIYGLSFDAHEQLVEGPSRSTLDSLVSLLRTRRAQRFRIVAYEMHVNNPQQRTAARIASLRAALQKRGADLSKIEFVAAGSNWTGTPIIAAIQRLMASRIDLEIVH